MSQSKNKLIPRAENQFSFLHNEQLGTYIFSLLSHSDLIREGAEGIWKGILKKSQAGTELSIMEQDVVRSIIKNEKDNHAISTAFIKSNPEFNPQLRLSQDMDSSGSTESWKLVDMVVFLEEFCTRFGKYLPNEVTTLTENVSTDVNDVLKNSNGLPEMPDDQYVQERMYRVANILRAQGDKLSPGALQITRNLLRALSKTIPFQDMQKKITSLDLVALSYLPKEEKRLKEILLKKSIDYDNYPFWFIHIRKNEIGKTMFDLLNNRFVLEQPLTADELQEIKEVNDVHLSFAINLYQRKSKKIGQERQQQEEEVTNEQKNRVLRAQAGAFQEVLLSSENLIAFEKIVDFGVKKQLEAVERLLFMSVLGKILQQIPVSPKSLQTFWAISQKKGGENSFITMKNLCLDANRKEQNGELSFDEALANIGKFFFSAEKKGEPIASYKELLEHVAVENAALSDDLNFDLEQDAYVRDAIGALLEESYTTIHPNDSRTVGIIREFFEDYAQGKNMEACEVKIQNTIIPIFQKLINGKVLREKYIAKFDGAPDIQKLLREDITPQVVYEAFMRYVDTKKG